MTPHTAIETELWGKDLKPDVANIARVCLDALDKHNYIVMNKPPIKNRFLTISLMLILAAQAFISYLAYETGKHRAEADTLIVKSVDLCLESIKSLTSDYHAKH